METITYQLIDVRPPAPTSASKRDAPVGERSTWAPRKRETVISVSQQQQTELILQFNNANGLSNNNNLFQNNLNSFAQNTVIVINQNPHQRLNQQQLLQEQQLTQLLQEQLFFRQVQSLMCDNVRRNHFNAQNALAGQNVNTVIVILQEVIDNRPGINQRRLLTRQINSGFASDQQQNVVIIQENLPIVINGHSLFQNGQFVGNNVNTLANLDNSNNVNKSAILSKATAPGAPPHKLLPRRSIPVQDYQPSVLSAFQSKNNLIPAGVVQPQLSFGILSEDPAAIVLQNQQLFVAR
ncbi:hypothetical protein HYFRA_00002771 [Hymenoscyphus fraxineus]|uniref:Uncharacterized protein n=1 Tax=Hymenoscyphus fraxineus TaxID=746836 RepID=A0A9N9KS37_9HELO|nr:hypothetical protein HYFRA_00002771 [Hymenoscyphus fraxineus]